MNVLVVFYSCGGETERLALAAGVGAIQARANIRLRRVPPGPDVQPAAMSPGWREHFERMARDYVAPRLVDVEWADALIVAASAEDPGGVDTYLEQLVTLTSLDGKLVAPLPSDIDSVGAGNAFGRDVVARATALNEQRRGR